MHNKKLKYVIYGLIIFFIALVFATALRKNLGFDEYENIYAAWSVSEGHVLYKDYWQVHTPLLYFFLAPLFYFFHTLNVIYAARLTLFLLVLLNGYFLYCISKRLFDKTTALFTILCFLASYPVLCKTVEIRPDILVVLFANISLYFLCKKSMSSWTIFLSGFSAALAILSKQSGIIYTIGVFAIFLIFSLLKDKLKTCDYFLEKTINIKSLLVFGIGLIIPLLIFLLYLIKNNSFGYFVDYAINNDFLNAALFKQTLSRSQKLGPGAKVV